jgi:hypothetical protein
MIYYVICICSDNIYRSVKSRDHFLWSPPISCTPLQYDSVHLSRYNLPNRKLATFGFDICLKTCLYKKKKLPTMSCEYPWEIEGIVREIAWSGLKLRSIVCELSSGLCLPMSDLTRTVPWANRCGGCGTNRVDGMRYEKWIIAALLIEDLVTLSLSVVVFLSM